MNELKVLFSEWLIIAIGVPAQKRLLVHKSESAPEQE